MREIIEIPIRDIKPDKKEVLKLQGFSHDDQLSEKMKTLFQGALDLFYELSESKGILSEISIPEFAEVYHSEWLNEERTPLDETFPQAENLFLFAVTLGKKVTEKIDELFRVNEFALGNMLDSVASVGTEEVALSVENYSFHSLIKKGEVTTFTGMLRYSPGYCGWHMSGQKKLFEFLHPEDIGITLLESFLMKPLKSISGVIVFGKKEIFVLDESYPFCGQCKTRSCRDRIKALSGN